MRLPVLLPFVLILLDLFQTTYAFVIVPRHHHQQQQQQQQRASKNQLLRRWTSQEERQLLEQSKAPIVHALALAATRIKAPFFFPGHKMGRGLPVALPGPFAPIAEGMVAAAKSRQSRDSVWQHDLPEIPELDNLFAPEGPIKEAETLAAQAFGGAQRTWFLVNGSTAGVLAALLAVVRRHQQQRQEPDAVLRISKVLLPRNVHKSAINGLILALSLIHI